MPTNCIVSTNKHPNPNPTTTTRHTDVTSSIFFFEGRGGSAACAGRRRGRGRRGKDERKVLVAQLVDSGAGLRHHVARVRSSIVAIEAALPVPSDSLRPRRTGDDSSWLELVLPIGAPHGNVRSGILWVGRPHGKSSCGWVELCFELSVFKEGGRLEKRFCAVGQARAWALFLDCHLASWR